MRILRLVLDVFESCFVTSFEHQVVWDVENLKWRVRSFVNDEVEFLELLVFTIFVEIITPGVHSGPEVIVLLFNPGEVAHEHVAVWLHLLGALAQDFVQHFLVVDEGSQGVRYDHTVDLLRQLKFVIKNVLAHQLELVHDADFCKILPGCLNHLTADIKSINLLGTLGCKSLSDWAWSTSDLHECLSFDALLAHLVEGGVVAELLHQNVRLAPLIVGVSCLVVLIDVFIPCFLCANHIFLIYYNLINILLSKYILS